MDAGDHQQVRQLLDEYLRMYASRDDRLTASFSEDFSGFTGGGDCLVKDRAEWVAITRQDFAQVKDPLRIELRDVSLQLLAEGIAVATSLFVIHLPIEDDFQSRETARLVLIFRREPAGWRISHSSISIPCHLAGAGEIDPLRELADRNRFLEEQVAERTLRLSEANGRLRRANDELAQEIAGHRRADEALRLSEDKLGKAFHASPDAVLITRASDGRVVEVNEGFTGLSGFERDEALGSSSLALDLWADPGDRERYVAAIRRDGSVRDMEFDFRIKSGDILRCLYAGALLDVDGEPHILSVVRDVTQQRRADAAAQESEGLLRGMLDNLILDNLQDAHVRTGPDGCFVMVSPSAARLYGYGATDDMVGLPTEALYADEAACQTMLQQLQENGHVVDYVGEGRRKDGSTFTVSLNAQVFRDEQGNVTGMEGFVRDITERKRAEEALARLNDELAARAAALEKANATIAQTAATDDLTGLANRRCFHESLAKAISLARRHGSPLALVSLDLDRLKQVNDSAGHAAGDEVLTSFAALLDALCRAEDLPARLGGDEFSVLLPGTDLVGARGFGERMLAAVRGSETLKLRGVTVSGGGAQWTPDELSDDLLRRADEALYAAKRSGGDAVAGGG